MQRLFYVVIATILIAACVGNGKEREVLDRVQAVINDHPDSALAILDSLRGQFSDFSQSARMRWQLLHAQAQNKSYIPFTSDSLMKEVVAYYERHGNSTDKMSAYYLLGSVYRDMGEIPASLQSFQKAAASADTTSLDCDFVQLAKVHVQMGTLFNEQYLPSEAIDCFSNGTRFALLADDTLLSLNILEQSLISYYEMGDYDAVIRQSEYVYSQLMRVGESTRAARSLSSAILISLNQKDIIRAGIYLRRIRQHVNLKEEGLSSSWLIYRAYEGMYALSQGDMHSAEEWFRLLISPACVDTDLKEMAYKGLMRVYQERHQADSMVKYACLYNEFNDSSNIFRHQEIVEKIHSQYKYDRLRRESDENRLRVQSRNHAIATIVVGLVILAGMVYQWYKRQKERDRLLQIRQISEYQRLLDTHRQACEDLHRIKLANDNKEALIRKKEETIATLKSQVEAYDAVPFQWENEVHDALRKMIDEFHKISINQGKADYLQMMSFRKVVQNCDPVFFAKLRGLSYMTNFREECICTFIRLGFSASEISILLGISPQALSNQKKRLLKHLFGKDGNASDLNDCIEKL